MHVKYLRHRRGSVAAIYMCVCVYSLFRATPTAYGGSRARDWIRAVAASLHHSHSNKGSKPWSAIYTRARGNARSLTHWARPGIIPKFSWILVGFVNHWATMGTPVAAIFLLEYNVEMQRNQVFKLLWVVFRGCKWCRVVLPMTSLGRRLHTLSVSQSCIFVWTTPWGAWGLC